jgi:hypothetical protein
MYKKCFKWLTQHRFPLLLISLLLVAMLHPILTGAGLTGAQVLLNSFLSLILLSSVYAVSYRRRLFIVVPVLYAIFFQVRYQSG